MKKNFILLAVVVFSAAFIRLVDHEPNFSPLGAMALFSGAFFSNIYVAIAMPILSLLLGDALMGFNGWAYPEQIVVVYGTFVLITLLGRGILSNNKHVARIGVSSLLASIAFFIITNFAVWAQGFWSVGLYPTTAAGLIQSYVMAIPFFHNTLFSDLMYSGIFFGTYYLIKINLPALQEQK